MCIYNTYGALCILNIKWLFFQRRVTIDIGNILACYRDAPKTGDMGGICNPAFAIYFYLRGITALINTFYSGFLGWVSVLLFGHANCIL